MSRNARETGGVSIDGTAGMPARAAGVVLVLFAAAALSSWILNPSIWIPAGFLLGGLAFTLFMVIEPVRAFLAWYALTPTLFCYFTLRPGMNLPNLTVDRIAMPVTLLIYLLLVALRTRPLIAPGRMEAIMLVFSALAIASLLVKGGAGVNVYFQKSDLKSNLYLFIGSYAFPLLLFFLGKNLIVSDDDARSFVRVLWGLGVYLSLVGIAQVLYDPRFLVPKTVEQIHYGRAVGPFGDATELGTVVALCFLATLYGSFREPERFKPALAVPSLALMGAGIVLSYTRAVWIGSLLGIGAVMLTFRKLRPWLVAILLCLVAVAGLTFLKTTGTSMLAKRTTSLSPIYARVVLLATAANLIAARPIVGYGFSRYAFQEAKATTVATFGSVSAKYGTGPFAAHNEVLNMGVMLGLVGLALYLTIWAGALRSCVRLLRGGTEERFIGRTFGLFAAAGFGLYMFQGMIVNLISLPFLSGLAYLMVGLCAGACARQTQRGPATARALSRQD